MCSFSDCEASMVVSWQNIGSAGEVRIPDQCRALLSTSLMTVVSFDAGSAGGKSVIRRMHSRHRGHFERQAEPRKKRGSAGMKESGENEQDFP